MDWKAARRWYRAGAALSVLAVISGVMAAFLPRWARSVSFALTLVGFLAVTRPSWDKHGSKISLWGMSFGVFATELAILWTGLARD